MAVPSEPYECVPLTPDLAEDLAALFDRSELPCYCRYYHFAGDKNDWQLRCAQEPEQNREEMIRSVERGDSAMLGVVARTASLQIVGWMKLCPEATLPKLYARAPYRALAPYPPRDGVLAIGCMLVDGPFRRRGVARAMLAAGTELARSLGARAIEAFPRQTAEPLPDAQAMRGPYELLSEAGFVVVRGSPPYPVLRLDLEP